MEKTKRIIPYPALVDQMWKEFCHIEPIKIKGSCEQLMDECILVPLFQNESSCENEFCRCKSYVLNGFALRLVLTQRQNATRKWPIG